MLIGTADPLGNVTTATYDAVGRATDIVDSLGNAAGGVPAEHTTQYVYDPEDRVRFVKLPAPQAGGAQLVTESRYDAVGNRDRPDRRRRPGHDLRLRRARWPLPGQGEPERLALNSGPIG